MAIDTPLLRLFKSVPEVLGKWIIGHMARCNTHLVDNEELLGGSKGHISVPRCDGVDIPVSAVEFQVPCTEAHEHCIWSSQDIIEANVSAPYTAQAIPVRAVLAKHLQHEDGSGMLQTSDPLPTLVVCHGMGGSVLLGEEYAQALVQHGILVVSPQFTAHGNNEPREGAYFTFGYMEAVQLYSVITWLRSWGCSSRIVLLGFSAGAIAATAVAAVAELSIDGLVLDRALLSLPLQIRAELGKHLSLPCRSLDKVSSKAARVFQECYGFDVASFTDIFRLAALEPQKAACLKALPVLAGYSEQDDTVSFEHYERLAEIFGEGLTRVKLAYGEQEDFTLNGRPPHGQDIGHNNSLPLSFRQDLMAFLLRVLLGHEEPQDGQVLVMAEQCRAVFPAHKPLTTYARVYTQEQLELALKSGWVVREQDRLLVPELQCMANGQSVAEEPKPAVVAAMMATHCVAKNMAAVKQAVVRAAGRLLAMRGVASSKA